MSKSIEHPLPINTKVESIRKICPCKGGGEEIIQGKIIKVIVNQSGMWYYLDSGAAVRANTICTAVKP